MKVKKFYGSDNHDAIAKVRGELGSNAVILHQRKVKPKGILGVFKRSIIEVVAAIEDMPSSTIKFNTSNIAKTQELDLRKRVESKSKDKGLEKEINDIKSMLGTVVNQMQDINLSKTSDSSSDIKDSYIYAVTFLEVGFVVLMRKLILLEVDPDDTWLMFVLGVVSALFFIMICSLIGIRLSV